MNPLTLTGFDAERKQMTLIRLTRQLVHFACICLLIFGAAAVQAQSPASAIPAKPAPETTDAKAPALLSPVQKIVEQGISVEFTIDSQKGRLARPRAGEDSVVKFKITDTTTGTPVKGLNLSVWMSLRQGDKALDTNQCKERIRSFVGGSLRERPDVDLNSYYILAMNKSADITVIDPLLGFGGSKLLALVMLKSPGEDWILSNDRERLFVSLPLINQVAVVDTRSWTVATYIDTGARPSRLTLQSDQKYLWVANDDSKGDAAGVTVIDTGTLKPAARILTGAGHHELIISGDNRFAFVSNQESGTVSIIDVRKLAKTEDVKVGSNPVSLGRSELSKAIYTVSESEGTITVIDEQSQKVVTRLKAKPGLRSIRFAPGGRYGFAVNTKGNTVNIFDAASNRMLHEITLGKSPDQIIFSDTFAFVRSLGTETISMIRLATLSKDVEITDFPGGQLAPDKASAPVRADSIVLAPEGNSVILANPADKTLYYYTEGMSAPMGDFQNYRREPSAVLVVDRSLRETHPGVYSTTMKLPASGKYDIAFLADAPRISHCFEAAADANPLLKEARQIALRLEPQMKEMKMPVGQNFALRFKLIETATNMSKDDLKDVRVLTFSGAWQRRDLAKSIGGGVYEINLNVPETGAYTVFVESGSMHVKYQDLQQMMLLAVEEKPATAVGASNAARKP
jgi:YVTN family beta-propeller protein